MNFIDLLLLLAAMPALGGFIYRYARYSPWRATFQGRTLMGQKVAMLAFIATVLIGRFIDYPGEQIVRRMVVAVLVVLFWVMFAGLLDAQRESGRMPRRKKERKQ